MRVIHLSTSVALLTILAFTSASAQEPRGGDDNILVWSGRIADGGLLTVKNIIGGITITEARDDRVEVRASKRTRARGNPADISFDVDESQGGATICTVYRGESACDEGGFNNVRASVQYTIALPRGLRIKASTGNGELSVAQGGSDVELRTGNGAIHVGETDGRVTASTGNGDVEIENARGPVRTTTGNGRIVVSTAAGPVAAHTGNGDIDVRIKTLRTESDMEFTSGSGAVRVTLPADFNGELDASTGNGELRTDFDIHITGRLDPQHMRGIIGSGGRLLKLHTGNGRLEIRKG